MASRTRVTSVKLKVPANSQPGDTLELLIGGDSVFVEVPPGAQPGQTVVVQAELPEFVTPPQANAHGYVPQPPPPRAPRPQSEASVRPQSRKSQVTRSPDMIHHLGGGLCACMSDMGVCCCGLFCHSYLQARSLADAGQGSVFLNCLLSVFEYNGGVICLAHRVDILNVQLGGDSAYVRRICTHCFCARCAACQLARAVKKAKEMGLIGNMGTLTVSQSPTAEGAPPAYNMSR